jgi:hypothetical protein
VKSARSSSGGTTLRAKACSSSYRVTASASVLMSYLRYIQQEETKETRHRMRHTWDSFEKIMRHRWYRFLGQQPDDGRPVGAALDGDQPALFQGI